MTDMAVRLQNVSVVNEQDLISEVEQSAKVSRSQAEAAVDAVLHSISVSPKAGRQVRIAGIGTFTLRNARPAVVSQRSKGTSPKGTRFRALGSGAAGRTAKARQGRFAAKHRIETQGGRRVMISFDSSSAEKRSPADTGDVFIRNAEKLARRY
jgi:nucleoid DNA-binding protein